MADTITALEKVAMAVDRKNPLARQALMTPAKPAVMIDLFMFGL